MTDPIFNMIMGWMAGGFLITFVVITFLKMIKDVWKDD